MFNTADYIVLALIFSAVVAAVFKIFKDRKKGIVCIGCSECKNCCCGKKK